MRHTSHGIGSARDPLIHDSLIRDPLNTNALLEGQLSLNYQYNARESMRRHQICCNYLPKVIITFGQNKNDYN